MAAFTVSQAKSATLSGTTADVVTLTDFNGRQVVEVINRTGSDPLTFTYNGGTPTALIDDGLVVMPGSSCTAPLQRSGFTSLTALVVRVVGNGNAYTVQVL
jgi:hypothetical protein